MNGAALQQVPPSFFHNLSPIGCVGVSFFSFFFSFLITWCEASRDIPFSVLTGCLLSLGVGEFTGTQKLLRCCCIPALSSSA
ncbi:hypothetical protein B0T24DRAFT_606663 [Lasiosphaeria ovina]|uniref:Uncharacterized protein n=1 Tax=Lasiosphaeria ovina TaxID=92902 RepID=A0AAE0NLT6_9PEZI|nr:hypothetical protein B0T24DRAFT_606663 [Lasiosphaeria ovina]